MDPVDEIVGLFAPPLPGPSMDMRYRQGTIVEFDPVTLANRVSVGGTVFSDLQLLGVGESQLLIPGAVVGIASITSESGAASWAIMGRLVTPNTPDAVNATSLLNSFISTASVFLYESTDSNVETDLATVGPEVTVNVRGTGRILVMCSATITWNPAVSSSRVHGGFFTTHLSGANVMGSNPFIDGSFVYDLSSVTGAEGGLLQVSVMTQGVYEDLATGPTKIAMKYGSSDSGVYCAFEARTITVITL